MRGRIATASILGFAAASCSGGSGAPEVSVDHAVVTLPAAAGRPGAAYFRIETEREGLRLVRLSSAAAGRVELHDTGMRPAASFAVPPDEPLHFQPGGRHAMLYDLSPSLRPGGTIALTFTFEGAQLVTVQAEVRAPGDVPSGH